MGWAVYLILNKRCELSIHVPQSQVYRGFNTGPRYISKFLEEKQVGLLFATSHFKLGCM